MEQNVHIVVMITKLMERGRVSVVAACPIVNIVVMLTSLMEQGIVNLEVECPYRGHDHEPRRVVNSAFF